jgi:hypothetical protein
VVLFLAATALASCATRVPPTVTLRPQVELDPNAGIFVAANRERPRVLLSLVDAGLKVAEDYKDARYSLSVSIGRSRGGGRCGSNANIAYILDAIATGQRAMVIKGRGQTGECQPNILDDMSRQLATSFGR